MKTNTIQLKDGTELIVSTADFKKIKSYSISDNSKSIESLYNTVMSFKFDFEVAHKLVKELKAHKNILAELLQAYIYIIADNPIRSKSILKNIMKKEMFYYSMTSDVKSLKIQKQVDMTLRLLKKIEGEMAPKKTFNHFIFYLYSNSTGLFKKTLDDNFEIKRSNSYLREQYKSVQFGKPYPFVWGPPVFNTVSQVEYAKFIDESNIGTSLLKGKLDNLLFFRSVLGISKKYKSALLDGIRSLKVTNDFYLKQVYFRVLSDDIFFKFITAHLEARIGLIASLKRSFYRETVKLPLHQQYSIQELISLGDIDFDYILKTLAFEYDRL